MIQILTPILAEVYDSNGFIIGEDEGVVFWTCLGAIAVFFIAIGIVSLVGCMWKVFTKAGQPGWATLIPAYNFIVLLRIAGLAWYWAFTPVIILSTCLGASLVASGLKIIPLFLISPLVGAIAYLVWIVWVHHRISTRFGYGIGMTIGLTLLGPFFWLILGFGDSKYIGEQPARA